MLFNDLSAREWQFATPQWMPGKVFDGAAPCGPALVTKDEAGAHDAIEFKLELNGEVMQEASTADLIHSVPALVAHLSTLMTLEPGDVIATGHAVRSRQRARAARLAEARGRGRDLLADARRAANHVRVMDERVERGMRRQLEAAPDDRIGWKLALNAPAIVEALGIGEPALGGLFRSRVVSGTHSLAGAVGPAVEPELIIEAGEGGTVARLGVALEVVDLDRPLDDVEEVVAANIFHRAVAFGSLTDSVDPGRAVFRVNEQERAVIEEFEAPADTLAFVDRFLQGLGGGLAEGELVIAGALAPATPVVAGDVASLSVDGIGSVSLAFTA